MMVNPTPNNQQSIPGRTTQEFAIELLECCEKKYQKLIKKDNVLKQWTESYLEELKTNPYIGEKLEVNFPRFRSIHYLGNKYRIIYKIFYEPVPKIIICQIGHRSESYSDLAKLLHSGK